MSSYTMVNYNEWERKMHCDLFRNYAMPQYSISFDLDITRFYENVKAHGWSFTLAMIYMITKSANEIENFRYRFEDGKVVLYDGIETSFTYLHSETKLMKNVVVPMQESIEAYLKVAHETIEAQKVYFTGTMGNGIYQFSAIPWIQFTHISHTDSGKKDQAVPMFDWGKFYDQNGRKMMPFSIQAHHSFVDGIHMGQLAENLQNHLNETI